VNEPLDPFEVLGLTRIASVDEVRAARRRLAFEHHPDRGGDPRRMQQLNEAFEAAIAHATGRRRLADLAPGAGPPAGAGSGTGAGAERPSRPARRRFQRTVDHDMPSFVIEALPAEAYEALMVVASWIGEVLLDEPPYLLEVHLHDPAPCWCRLDLVPDAGSSTVSLTIAAVEPDPLPSVEVVRDTWVANLNQLGAS
jgi:hypothetical protein